MQETIVLYPSLGLGHVVSMVELGKLILHHYNNRYSITILLTTGLWDTPTIISYINSVSQAFPSISFFRFPSISIDPSQNCSGSAIAFHFIRLHAPNASILFNKSPNLIKSPRLSLIFSALRLYLWEKILTSTSLPLVLLPLLLSFKSQSLINKPLEEASKICPTRSSILRVCHR
ncbi:hypothetical protein J1N35_000166 [Gossypium stocksii]|uniref:Uncharacterized protein n=1 Tax=Gossypium stocksii TaxID=47602 RepID=A0A9D3WI97_9ROSI|nr:hypothetical protein J1N35_000166 [Gossypium stocksii]